MYHDIRINIDFLDDLRELNVDSEKWENVERALVRLKYVNSAWIDHTCIIEVNFETSKFDVAKRRADILKTKVRRVLEKYGTSQDKRPRCAQA